MARSSVPKFGNWDTEANIPYTTYFENARRNSSSSEKVNTKNSPDNPYLTDQQQKSTLRRSSESSTAREKKHDRVISQDDGEPRRSVDSPSRHEGGRRVSGNSTPKRASKPNGGSVPSAGHSPLHPHYQAKIGSRGSAASSPSWERKSLSEGSHGLAPSTPGRSRLRSVPPRGNETPDRGASVPKFGEWDETDPSSADGFTHIFNKVKEERHGNAGNTPGSATDNQRANGQKHYRGKDPKGCCCFPWGRS